MTDKTLEELPPGALLADPPRLTLAQLRGYAIALLMHKGWLSACELQATVASHCNIDDLKVGGVDPFTDLAHDGTRLEALIEELFLEFSSSGLVYWDSDQRVWMPALKRISKFVQFSICLNCDLPGTVRKHIQQDVLRDAQV